MKKRGKERVKGGRNKEEGRSEVRRKGRKGRYKEKRGKAWT